jgi:predicted nucleotidyltransferase
LTGLAVNFGQKIKTAYNYGMAELTNKSEDLVNKITEGLSALNEVQAIAIGGSRATGKADNKSDYDIYVYLQNNVSNDSRKTILSNYCSYMEIGNTYWELEDNCILLNGINMDIIYRNANDFEQTIIDVVENGLSRNGYTTCLWHNLMTCNIVFDRTDYLSKLKERFNVPYPKTLRANIIKNNMNLLTDSITAYDRQIEKSVKRHDFVNINNRITAFMDSYFDVIFALNEIKHPGEKRIVEICLGQCKLLPNEFEENIKSLFYSVNNDTSSINDIIKKIIYELKVLTKEKQLLSRI